MERYLARVYDFGFGEELVSAMAELDLMGHYVYVPVRLNEMRSHKLPGVRTLDMLEEELARPVVVEVVGCVEDLPWISIVNLYKTQSGESVNQQILDRINNENSR